MLYVNGGSPISCSAAQSTLPGTYTSLFSGGTVSGSTFTQTSSGSWTKAAYIAATPTPAPTSSPGPVPTSSPFTYTFYIGAYSVLNGSALDTTGCFYLIVYTSGSSTSTYTAGSPNFGTTPYTISGVPTFGTVTAMSITGLSANSGSGTFTLSNGETGTITITSQFQFSEAQARQIMNSGPGAGRSPF
jgi:hypothetical protein